MKPYPLKVAKTVEFEPEESPYTPDGFVKVAKAEVFVNRKTGSLIILGEPPGEDRVEDEETGHNCDAMGCGWDHVVIRGQVVVPHSLTEEKA